MRCAADPALLGPAGKGLLRRVEAVHLGDRVDRHEADIVPLHRVGRAGIAEADPDLHGRELPPIVRLRGGSGLARHLGRP